MFRLIALIQLNNLTPFDTISCLVGLEVTHQNAVPEFPDSVKGFYVVGFCFFIVMFLPFWSRKHHLSWIIAIPFAMLVHLEYLTYCKICDQLLG